MTDRDFFPRDVSSGWRKVARMRANGDLGDSAREKALADSLRRNGCRQLHQVAQLLTEHLLSPPERWHSELDAISRLSGYDAHTRCAIDAAIALRERPHEIAFAEPSHVAQRLAETTIERIARRHEDRALSSTDGLSWAEPAPPRDQAVRALARQLLEAPDGSRIRAPRRARPALGTAALLSRVVSRRHG